MIDITDIKSCSVAGFDIAGWELDNGKFMFHGSDEIIDKLPDEITCNGRTYTLENVLKCSKDTNGTFINAQYA